MKAKTLLIQLFILAGMVSYGQSLKDTMIVDYKAVDKAVREMSGKYGPGNVLVVMDIDNTILTSDTDLGSDLWYQWQMGELDIKPGEGQLLSQDCLFNEAIGLLYELSTMTLTDSLLPEYIGIWQISGVTLFALTSRSPHYRDATERELERNHIDLSASELKTVDGNKMFLDYTLGRDLSYSDGIMMTTGMNKGEMLSHILDRSGRSFKAIIFVDDTRKNIDAVKTKYSACHDTDVILFHYTRIITERLSHNNNMLLTVEQANKMAEDWQNLIRTLNTIFPERAAKSQCARQGQE